MKMNDAELKEMKEFITKKGGYQGEKGGARDWFRCTYWVPLDVFDEVTLERWFEPDMEVR